jgi:hypothetical protein
MKIFLFLILLSLSCKSIQDSKPIENPEDKATVKKWIVTPDSGLNLRDSPSRKAKSIRLLPRGTMVIHKQLVENEKPDTIEDQKGKWLKVEVGNDSGWVFDVYLSEPVFSPSGDTFYFVTVKDQKTGNIVSTMHQADCENLYAKIEYLCSMEIRYNKNFKIINKIEKRFIGNWYNNETLVSYYVHGDGGYGLTSYHTININTLEEKNLYMHSSQNFQRVSRERNQEYVGWVKTCIFDKCFELSRGVNEVYILFYLEKLNERIEDKEKTLINKFQISITQNFWIKDLSEDQFLKLKHPYTGNFEFSVDKRNYLLHVPTGKITEVKEK